MKHIAAALLFCLLLTGTAATWGQEICAFWADGFEPGFKSPQEVDQLLARLRQANCNAVFAQMRKSGDAYYLSRYEPWAADDPAHFDALAYLIDKAHHGTPRIAVHAWINTCAVGGSRGSPYHIVAAHPEWLSLSDKGADYDNEATKIDPGNPDAADWTFRVYLDVARHYDVDGIHFDFVRYGGANWGYNPVSVARYNARYRTAGQPKPGDERWKQWRRDQVTALVRKVYAMSAAVRPKMAVSAATITWGDGPQNLAFWNEKSAPMNRVFQDWRSWMREGILDLNCLMSYYSEAKHPDMFRHWTDWCKDNQYRRWAVPSSGIWLNPIQDSVKQIQRLRAPTRKRNRARGGVLLYSYAGTNAGPDGKDQTYNDAFYSALSQPSAFCKSPPFERPSYYPEIPWKEHPTRGHLKGFVLTADGLNPVDGAKVVLTGRTSRICRTDGTGFYAFIDLPPGRYTVRVVKSGYRAKRSVARLAAGEAATATFFVGSAATPVTDSVADAAKLHVGSPVRLRGIEVDGGTDVFPGHLLVRDIGGDRHLLVNLAHSPLLPFQMGDIVAVTGTMASIDGEAVIGEATVRLMDMRFVPDAAEGVDDGAPAPGITRLTGTVADVATDRFTLHPDSGETVEVLLAGRKDPGIESVEEPLKSPEVGSRVRVIGIVTEAQSADGKPTIRLRPHSQVEIVVLPQPAWSGLGRGALLGLVPCALGLVALGNPHAPSAAIGGRVMAIELAPELVTVEEYLESERNSDIKHEYHAGQVYAMAGASPEHTFIASNITGELHPHLKTRGCHSAQSDLRVRVEAADLYTYPDVVVACVGARYTDDRPAALLNPVVLVEVLSRSSHDYDRGTKFELYQMLESLTDYLVFRQDRPYAEHHIRQADGAWLLRVSSGMDAVVEIESLGCQLALKDVYAGIEFPPTATYFVREPVADLYAEPRADWAKALDRAQAT